METFQTTSTRTTAVLQFNSQNDMDKIKHTNRVTPSLVKHLTVTDTSREAHCDGISHHSTPTFRPRS